MGRAGLIFNATEDAPRAGLPRRWREGKNQFDPAPAFTKARKPEERRAKEDTRMPIFEYVCRECEHRFERIVYGEAAPEECPSCGAKRLEKQLSVFAAVGGGERGSADFSANDPFGACGSCGDPRGPGSCATN